jgi:hypothetical protein
MKWKRYETKVRDLIQGSGWKDTRKQWKNPHEGHTKFQFLTAVNIFQQSDHHEAGSNVFRLPYSSTLKMEATCSSETSVDFQRTTQRYNPEDKTLHNHRCENLKSYAVWKKFADVSEEWTPSAWLTLRL